MITIGGYPQVPTLPIPILMEPPRGHHTRNEAGQSVATPQGHRLKKSTVADEVAGVKALQGEATTARWSVLRRKTTTDLVSTVDLGGGDEINLEAQKNK